jgi:hypothetical protein
VALLLPLAAMRPQRRSRHGTRTANTVQLTIYNSEDLTLVRESRVVTFQAGS